MKVLWKDEADDWGKEGDIIISPDRLAKIKNVIENEGPVIVEHRFYRSGSAPDRRVFDYYDNFLEYLEKQAKAGDAIEVWSFANVCTLDNRIAFGKCPDDDGLIPKKGAY